MTIPYNFAYVQTETLNFTFARQAVIVYMYFDANMHVCTTYGLQILVRVLPVRSSAFYTSPPLHRAAECPFCVCQLLHFCQLLSNPSIDLELEYIFGKPMKRRFQRCIVRIRIV